MVNKAHSTLTGSDLHEPKGVAAATTGQVYISNGSGSGVWTNTGATIGASTFTTGDLKSTWKLTADSGWVMCDDGTIGNLASGATTLAAATTVDLYTLLWNNFANAEAAVSSGRGASAAADYASNKTIALPKMLGRVYGIAGAGFGLTSRAMGKTTGTETHQLVTAELASHSHTITDVTHGHTGSTTTGVIASAPNANASSPSIATAGATAAVTIAAALSGITGTNTAGSGTAHANMQPTVFLKMMVKL